MTHSNSHHQVSEMTGLRDDLIERPQVVPRGLEDYFPVCTREDCARVGRKHRDVLPHQAEFVLATEKYLALVGGWGGGKTIAAAVRGILLSKQVRGNRGFVGRRTYSKLHDSTLPIYLDVMQRVGIDFEAREVRDGWPHRVILPNDSEIVFRETKDLGRFLGPEYGWFHLDEAAEEPKKTFTDLQGRLRLPYAAKYLTGFITTNPPHHTDWIPEIFGAAPGTHIRGKSRYRYWKVPTSLNPFLPQSYIDDIRANHPESEIRRILDGEYGFTFEGKAVYSPPFEFGRHVAEVPPLHGVGVVRSWDYGWHGPCVTWHQFPLCAHKTVHWQQIGEYLGANMETEDLYAVVMDQSKTLCPDHVQAYFLDCGDHAGAQISEKGPGPIIRLARKYGLRTKHRPLMNIDPGIALVRQALRDGCPCGRPVFQIDRMCKHTIAMFAGGYHYPAPKNGYAVTKNDKPKKDGFYDHPADTVRYAAENFYRGLIREPDLLDRLLATDGPIPQSNVANSWEWIEQVSAGQQSRMNDEYERIRNTPGAV